LTQEKILKGEENRYPKSMKISMQNLIKGLVDFTSKYSDITNLNLGLTSGGVEKEKIRGDLAKGPLIFRGKKNGAIGRRVLMPQFGALEGNPKVSLWKGTENNRRKPFFGGLVKKTSQKKGTAEKTGRPVLSDSESCVGGSKKEKAPNEQKRRRLRSERRGSRDAKDPNKGKTGILWTKEGC